MRPSLERASIPATDYDRLRTLCDLYIDLSRVAWERGRPGICVLMALEGMDRDRNRLRVSKFTGSDRLYVGRSHQFPSLRISAARAGANVTQSSRAIAHRAIRTDTSLRSEGVRVWRNFQGKGVVLSLRSRILG